MVNYETFCPFERIIARFKKAALGAKVQLLKVDFGSFGVRRYDMTTEIGQKIYFDGGFTVPQRREFSSLPNFKGVVEFDGQRFDFVVKHCLYREVSILKEFQGKKPVNNKIGTEPSFYPEALTIVPSRRDLDFSDQGGKLTSEFIPYMNYLIFDPDLVEGKEIEIYGPACSTTKTKIGAAKSAIGNIGVYCDSDVEIEAVKPETTIVATPQTKNYNFVKPVVLLRYGKAVTPLKVTQTAVKVGGRPVLFTDLFMIYQIAVFLESQLVRKEDPNISLSDGVLIIDLVDRADKIGLNNEIRDWAFANVVQNEFVKKIFERFRAVDDGIEVQTKRSGAAEWVAFVSSYSNAACFAMCSAVFTSLLLDGSITAIFSALVNQVDDDGVVPVYDKVRGRYILEGRSTNFWNGEKHSLDTLNGVGVVAGKLNKLTAIPNTEGFAIVGFDGTVGRAQSGPDHYIVCYAQNEKLYLIYDPWAYASTLTTGKDVTGLFNACAQSERAFYHLDDAIVVSWLNSKATVA
jgi:hypothetical protein